MLLILSKALVLYKAIKKVEFIGSALVGRIIRSFSSKYLEPVLIELNRKCPTIVLNDFNNIHLNKAISKTTLIPTLFIKVIKHIKI